MVDFRLRTSRPYGPDLGAFNFADPSVAVSTFRQLRADAAERREQNAQARQRQEQRQMDERLRERLGGFTPSREQPVEAGTGQRARPTQPHRPSPAGMEQQIAGALAESPGGGEALLSLRLQQAQRMREQRGQEAALQREREDEIEDRFHELMKEGQVDLARAYAQQNQLGVPEQVFQSAEKARDFGTILDLVKGNRHDPQYGGRLIQGFVQTGSIEKAIRSAGQPQPTRGERQSEPGQLQMIRYLLGAGIAQTPEEAFYMTQQSKGSAERAAMDLTEAWLEQEQERAFLEGRDPPSREQVTNYYQQTVAALQGRGTPAQGTQGAPGTGTMEVQGAQVPQARGEVSAAEPAPTRERPAGPEWPMQASTPEAGTARPVQPRLPQGGPHPYAVQPAPSSAAPGPPPPRSQAPAPQQPRQQQQIAPKYPPPSAAETGMGTMEPGRFRRERTEPGTGAQQQGVGGQAQPRGQQYTEQNPARPTTLEEFEALPPGAYYIDPGDNQLYELEE